MMVKKRIPLFVGALLLVMPPISYARDIFGLYMSRTEQFWGTLLCVVLGALVGMFFSDRFRKLRKLIFILFCAAVLMISWYALPTFGMGAAFIISAVIVFQLLRRTSVASKDTTFGSAQWATKDYLERHELTVDSGLTLGQFHYLDTKASPQWIADDDDPWSGSVKSVKAQQQSVPLSYQGNRHLLTVAPTRAGKGVSAIIPNLLTYEGSALVIDPKGENALISAARRGEGDEANGIPGLGQEVFVLDPWGITQLPQAYFNPLDWLDPRDPDINENAKMLADAILVEHGGANDPFWHAESQALLTGIILYVATDAMEINRRHLARVRDIITLGKDEFNAVLKAMFANSNRLVSTTAQRTASKDAKLASNVMAHLQSQTHFLDSDRIRQSLSKSSFKFEDFKTKRQTVYLVLPADRIHTFSPWLRLLVQQAITMNVRDITQKPDKPVLFMLDEMAALGKLTMVEQAYGLMAGFGIQLWGIVQDFGQLERLYQDSWETFIGNAGVIQYFGSRDLKTAEYFSKMCGSTTVQKVSLSNSVASAFGYGPSTQTQTDGYSLDVSQRQLAYADELMVLHGDQQLLFVENHHPIKAQKVRWYQQPKLAKWGVSLQ
ncbi:type IV secretory system conjugative DNA transfer family protein [Ferrimonas aestuarii]|uniref:Type IV secretory system conjugative DNA transfer family protein n=1 Tax=Ferrimonas aestuarii TaxID=2569539 RepID=A0A4U1BSE1_9GAMM|nr:type IV secretory system conjugative DNA transfer family protein [Ferrimonas aestuarii]TKB58553.1 type IV secretory system conjugative DNA transfer family protein [Ferrimonas aestuarii]